MRRARFLLLGLSVVALAVGASVALAGDGNNSLNAKACQKNGWMGLVTSTGAPFANQGACVSYGAKGGTLFKAQTITFAPLADKTFGDPDFAVSATASSGLAVTFTASGNCTVSGSTVQLTGAGSCTITAHQAGDSTWYAAPDVARTFSIAPAACISTDAQLRAAAAAGGSYCLSVAAPIAVTAGEVVVGSTLTLTSEGPGNATVTAQQNSRVFNVTGQLTLDNVTVTGGEIHDVGGGILAGPAASVVLNGQTSVTGNTAWQGGGVFVRNGTLTMNNAATVNNNSADQLGANVTTGGGGVYLDQTSARLVMNGTSSVSGNHVGAGAVSLGGGVLSNAGQTTLNDSASINGNQTLAASFTGQSRGGGIYFVNGGSLTLNGSSSITGNSAVNDGGGIFRIDNGFGTISGVTAANVANNTPNNCGIGNPQVTPPVPGCVG